MKKTTKYAPDNVDVSILDELQRDSRLSSAQVAARVGLSSTHCWRRISRLRRLGFVQEFEARLDRRKLGFDLVVFTQVRIASASHVNLNRICDALAALDEVIECYAIFGAYDFILKVVARDLASYQEFIHSRVSKIEGVEDVVSTMTLKELKSTSRLPLAPSRAKGIECAPRSPDKAAVVLEDVA